MGSGVRGKGFTGIIRSIAILSIALSLAIMIISIAVVTGFQNEIRGKVIGFGSHIQISHFDVNFSTEQKPISMVQDFPDQLAHVEGIKHIQVYANKAGLIKTDEDIHGVVMKGVGADFDWHFFSRHLMEGTIPNYGDENRSDSILISGYIARRLQITIGDDIWMYFIQDPPRIRKFIICGIYDTGLEELDKIFVLGDIRQIQRLNDWTPDQIGGFEVLIDTFSRLPQLLETVFDYLPFDLDAKSIGQLYPQIFDWLALLDMNVVVILGLMLLVAAINMITTLLISVLEKTSMIGVLKALGASNAYIRKVFLYHAAQLMVKGLVFGNIAGMLLCYLQDRFGLIKLAQESYYVSEVPINLDLWHILLLNLGTSLICMTLLILPSLIVTRIKPVSAIRFR
jgi:lipoprotein-releasing system permease protein